MEKFIQEASGLIKKFNSLDKIADFVLEEVIPSAYGEKTEKAYELNMKILKDVLSLI